MLDLSSHFFSYYELGGDCLMSSSCRAGGGPGPVQGAETPGFAAGVLERVAALICLHLVGLLDLHCYNFQDFA